MLTFKLVAFLKVQTLSPDGNSSATQVQFKRTSTQVQLAKQHNVSVPLDYVSIHLRNIDNVTAEKVISVTARHGMILVDSNGVPEPMAVKANEIVEGNQMKGLNETVWTVFKVEQFKLNTTIQIVTETGTVLANGILCTTQNLS